MTSLVNFTSSDASKVAVVGDGATASGVAVGSANVFITGGHAALEVVTDRIEVVSATTEVSAMYADIVTGAVFGDIPNVTYADASLAVTVDVNQYFITEGQVRRTLRDPLRLAARRSSMF